jgi:hypothetical protein
MISGNKGDGAQMRRTLQALYHPRNFYALHLDLEAPPKERVELARYVRFEPLFQEVGNVFVVGKANLVTYRGPTIIATTLHGAAILLRRSKEWNWFINLSASDYPLVTQDGVSAFLIFFCIFFVASSVIFFQHVIIALCTGLLSKKKVKCQHCTKFFFSSEHLFVFPTF